MKTRAMHILKRGHMVRSSNKKLPTKINLTGEKNWLAYLDSNQDKLNQNQLYYHYTIGQSITILSNGLQK